MTSRQPEIRTFERPDVTIRYASAGPDEAPALVLLHGAFLDHRVWEEQVAAFSPGYRLPVPDLRCEPDHDWIGTEV